MHILVYCLSLKLVKKWWRHQNVRRTILCKKFYFVLLKCPFTLIHRKLVLWCYKGISCKLLSQNIVTEAHILDFSDYRVLYCNPWARRRGRVVRVLDCGAEGRRSRSHQKTGNISLSTQQQMGIGFTSGKVKGGERRGLGPAFHMLCPRHDGALILHCPDGH